jgi:SPP1 family predicted phage head-tail adaptor
MAALNAGDLDQRVTIQTEARTSDGGGGYAVTWADGPTVWAKLTPASGREQLQAEKLESSTIYRVEIRRGPALKSADRIIWVTNGQRPLNVREILDAGGRSDSLVFLAEAGAVT